MEKIYLKYPYLDNFHGNIRRRFVRDSGIHVICDKTIFHPHNKTGQPGDRGTINDIPVVHVYEKDNDVIHVLEKDPGRGTQAKMHLDFPRRFDHMQQYMAYHLLSGLLDKIFGIHTENFEMGELYSTLDITPPDVLPEGWEKVIEDLSQQCINKALPIRTYYSSPSPKKKEKPVLMIHIPGVMDYACLEPYVANTGELFSVRIINSKVIQDKQRIYFIAGGRCHQEYRNFINILTPIAQRMETDVDNAFHRIIRAMELKEEYRYENQTLKKRLLESDLRWLQRSIQYIRGLGVICYFFHETREDLNALGDGLDANIILLGEEQGRLYMRVSEKSLSLNPLIEKYTEHYGIQGGGSLLKYQGMAENKPEEFLNTLFEQVKKRIR